MASDERKKKRDGWTGWALLLQNLPVESINSWSGRNETFVAWNVHCKYGMFCEDT